MSTIILSKIDSFLISALLLIVVGIYVYRYIKNTKLAVKCLLISGALALLQSSIESLNLIISTFPTALHREILMISYASPLVVCTALAMYEILFYCEYVLSENKITKILKKFWIIPIIIDILFFMVNYKTGLIYSVNENCDYVRGPLHYLHFSIVHVVGLFVFINTVKYFKENRKTDRYIIFLFLSCTLAASTFEIFGTANTLINPFNCFSIAMILIYIKINHVTLNSMTKLINIETFYRKVKGKIDEDKEFALALLDLDDMQKINNEHTYNEGNKVIKKFANILKLKVKQPNIVADAGSDEIIIYFENKNKEEIEEEIFKIYNNLKNDDLRLFKDYTLTFSYVVEEYNCKKYNTLNDMIQHLYYDLNKQKISE